MNRLALAASLTVGTAALTAIAAALPAAAVNTAYDRSNGVISYFPCNYGANYDNPRVPIQQFYNTCTVRVWFHQYTNYAGGHGWAYCINPPGATIPVSRAYPANIQISSNHAAC
jgi:hypothetical protein